MRSIKALAGDVLEVRVEGKGEKPRDHLFQMSTREECERWAANLVALAAAAGTRVPGYIVMPEQSGAAPEIPRLTAGHCSPARRGLLWHELHNIDCDAIFRSS